MKNRLIFYLTILSLVMSCERVNELSEINVDRITYGDCKSITTKSEDSERFEFKTADKYYLQIKHINALFNCEPGQLLVNVCREIDTIIVDENEETAMANCVCPYDLCYRIGPMEYGNYIIEIQRGGLLYAKFTVNFNALTSGVFEINV